MNGHGNAPSDGLATQLSFAKLSGAGDSALVPASGFAGIAASLESMTGQVYLAVVITRLVGIQAEESRPRPTTMTDGGSSNQTEQRLRHRSTKEV